MSSFARGQRPLNLKRENSVMLKINEPPGFKKVPVPPLCFVLWQAAAMATQNHLPESPKSSLKQAAVHWSNHTVLKPWRLSCRQEEKGYVIQLPRPFVEPRNRLNFWTTEKLAKSGDTQFLPPWNFEPVGIYRRGVFFASFIFHHRTNEGLRDSAQQNGRLWGKCLESQSSSLLSFVSASEWFGVRVRVWTR